MFNMELKLKLKLVQKTIQYLIYGGQNMWTSGIPKLFTIEALNVQKWKTSPEKTWVEKVSSHFPILYRIIKNNSYKNKW